MERVFDILNRAGIITPETIARAIAILMDDGCSLAVVGHAIYVWCDDEMFRIILELDAHGNFYISMVCVAENGYSYRCYDLEELGEDVPNCPCKGFLSHCLSINHAIEEIDNGSIPSLR